jgi:hypothetical protein
MLEPNESPCRRTRPYGTGERSDLVVERDMILRPATLEVHELKRVTNTGVENGVPKMKGEPNGNGPNEPWSKGVPDPGWLGCQLE